VTHTYKIQHARLLLKKLQNIAMERVGASDDRTEGCW